MIKMYTQPERRIFFEHFNQALIYSLGQTNRNARANAYKFHMRNGTDVFQDFFQGIIFKHKRVSTGNKHIADFTIASYILKCLFKFRRRAGLGPVSYKSAPGAV